MASGIYKITSPSGKIYIGQSIDLKARIGQYMKNCDKKQTRIYNSIKKYGHKNHEFEIICTCPEEYLDNLERYYIMYYNSFATKHGLNLRTGGGGGKLSEEAIEKVKIARAKQIPPMLGRRFTEEHKKNLSKSHTGKKMSKEAVENMRKSIAGKRLGENNNFYGKKHTQESKEKNRKSKLGQKHSEETKKKMSNAHKGKRKSPEAIEKSRLARIGRKAPEGWLQKMTEAKRRIKEEKALMIF